MEIKAALDYLAMAIRDSIRQDDKLNWEWLYDIRTAGDIIGMTSRQLIYWLKQNDYHIYHNVFNNYKFLTAEQIKDIRKQVLHRASAKECYPPRKAAEVPLECEEASGTTL